MNRWTRHLFTTETRTRSTWKLRAGFALLVTATLWFAGPVMARGVARSLSCDVDRGSADAAIVDNFTPDYPLFERARELREKGRALRVLVPVAAETDTMAAKHVELTLAKALVEAARLGAVEYVPVRIDEPITLNAVRDIRAYVQSHGIRSLIVVVPLFRSKRTELVYRNVFRDTPVSVACDPEPARRLDWNRSWHGRQNVAEQVGKLLYYRLYVLPFLT